MLQHTQTHSGEFGNCFQTAIACLLDLQPGALPNQHLIEKATIERRRAQAAKLETPPPYYAGHYSYVNALNAYLFEHHKLAYIQEAAWRLSALQFREPGLHLLAGPVERNEFHHVVVARHGEMICDTSPSRAGLKRIESFGWLVSVEGSAEVQEGYRWHQCSDGAKKRDLLEWQNRANEAPGVSTLCCCPLCFVDGDYV